MRKVLLGKLGLDAHWRGAAVVAKYLMEKGFEVVYVGNQTPEQLVEAAVQEDPCMIGVSMLSGSHIVLMSKFMQLLQDMEMKDIPVVLGGTIPKQDKVKLHELGVACIYTPGESLDTLEDFIGDMFRLSAKGKR
ncbi:MAG: cobalamin-dependent protein [Clostridiales bacterium]|jgi:methylmalonyl-CoA mutase C-terminal domain/subunit|nr:cobalamin-dependent protein [Clostridiales bacterium]